jgi:hypothetical protein
MSFNRNTQGFRFSFIFVIVFKIYFQNGMMHQINLDLRYPKYPISDHPISGHVITSSPNQIDPHGLSQVKDISITIHYLLIHSFSHSPNQRSPTHRSHDHKSHDHKYLNHNSPFTHSLIHRSHDHKSHDHRYLNHHSPFTHSLIHSFTHSLIYQIIYHPLNDHLLTNHMITDISITIHHSLILSITHSPNHISPTHRSPDHLITALSITDSSSLYTLTRYAAPWFDAFSVECIGSGFGAVEFYLHSFLHFYYRCNKSILIRNGPNVAFPVFDGNDLIIKRDDFSGKGAQIRLTPDGSFFLLYTFVRFDVGFKFVLQPFCSAGDKKQSTDGHTNPCTQAYPLAER